MAEELVSGPDLGGGFLFQLTRRRDGERAEFTYHAQDGGQDANGPPIGTPEPFGWARAEGMCFIGGRVCWHRRFALEDREVGAVRAAYNRTRFVMEAELAQAYRGAPVPWGAALREWTSRVGPALAALGAPWCLSGASAEAVVRGGSAARVLVLTVATTDLGVRAAASAVPEYLTEPAAVTEWQGRETLAARAFFGTLREGVRVEWASGAEGERRLASARAVDWNGAALSVALDPAA